MNIVCAVLVGGWFVVLFLPIVFMLWLGKS